MERLGTLRWNPHNDCARRRCKHVGKTIAATSSTLGPVDAITQFLTFNLKLREPSRHKAAVIHRAMRKATAARVTLLEEWQSQPDFAKALIGKLD